MKNEEIKKFFHSFISSFFNLKANESILFRKDKGREVV